jgi:hypothetical protein
MQRIFLDYDTDFKTCGCCRIRKPLKGNYTASNTNDGYTNICSKCAAARNGQNHNNITDYNWKPSSRPLTNTGLSKIPHTPAGDALFLEMVENACHIDPNLLKWIERESHKRTCYLELQRLLFARQSYREWV